MMSLSLLFAFSIGYFATCRAENCTWTPYPNQFILGGALVFVSSLEECQAECLQNPGFCQSIDFNPPTNGCWLDDTKDGKMPHHSINHYDYDCQTIDVVPITGSTNCISTNYPGPKTDLYNATNNVIWNYKIADFGFDWPQSSFLGIPTDPIVSVDRIIFTSSENMVYFRVVFKKNNGQVVTTNPIGPNDKNVALTGVNDVKRVDFYLAQNDFRRNVSLIDVSLKCSFVVFGLSISTFFFDVVKYAASLVPLGIIRVGGTSGTFSVSIAQDYPFIELNLTCAGVGIVSFREVSFGVSSNFDKVAINVWNGVNAVTVYDSNSVETDVFNPESIVFGNNVNGDSIRSTVIPTAIPNQGISGSISFKRYSVNAI